ncbi:MAG: FecR family protein, partial [Gammaproteobacteria bacterium]
MTSRDENPIPSTDDDIAGVIRAAGRRPVPSDAAYEQVLGAATAAWETKVRERQRNAWVGRLAATVAAVGVGLGVWFTLDGTQVTAATVTLARGEAQILGDDDRWLHLEAGTAVMGKSEIRTLEDGGSALRLSSGVQLRIAADTQLRLLTANEFELKAGRVYVDSDRFSLGGDLRLFTPFGEVHDIGTQFQVDVDSNRLRVRVREGQVSINRGGLYVEGTIGEELNVDRQGQVERNTISTHNEQWRWVEALADPFHTQGRSVKELLNWVARETGYALKMDAATERMSATVMLFFSGSAAEAERLTPLEALDVHMSTQTQFGYTLDNG